MEQKAIHIGMAVLVVALLLRLAGNWEKSAWEVGNTLLFLSTGRMVTAVPTEETTETTQPVPAAESPVLANTVVPVFGQQQEKLVEVSGQWAVDTADLLQKPYRLRQKKTQNLRKTRCRRNHGMCPPSGRVRLRW